jgi:Flp pilus assembly protein TadD
VAAGAALGKAIALSPKNADAWFNLGNAERGLGRFGAAAEGGEEEHSRAVELAPENEKY